MVGLQQILKSIAVEGTQVNKGESELIVEQSVAA
jgi:hypothetical protein